MPTPIENFVKTACFIIILLSGYYAIAQGGDDGMDRKNTVKYHVISQALYTESFVMSYERIVKPNQSFAIMAGYLQFPISLNSEIISASSEGSKKGLVLGGEYRFYLKKENKFSAPHGVFIGPYINMYNFSNERMLTITPPDGSPPTEADLETDINVVNIGFQMGYQFVINNRWTIDMVFIGPSLSQYYLKIKLDGEFDSVDTDLIENELLLGLLDKFPLLKDFLDDQEINLNGTNNKWAPGFRYQLNLGYRFGKSRK